MLRERLKLMLDVFSRRHKGSTYPKDAIHDTMRHKILLLCRDVFTGRWHDGYSPGGDYVGEFWSEIHRALQYIHGRPVLSSNRQIANEVEDAIQFLLTCSTQEFLDFIELIFRVDFLYRVTSNPDELVDTVNDLLRSEGLPYQLSPFVRHTEENAGRFGGTVIRTVSYPKAVRVDEEITFTHAVLPALTLLADAAYTSANHEFRAALEDYRKGDYGDCVVKCGSAFESVMKVICQKKGWGFRAQDTANPLLKTILSHSSLESFFEQPLMLIATVRNRLSTAHGAGTGVRKVERHVAEYVIASTAAAVGLLIHETN